MHQPKYAQSIIQRFNMTDANIATTPADTSIQLTKPSESTPTINAPYRQALGALMYLQLATRPDISFALNKCSQFATNYIETHWTALKRIIRYIKGTTNYSLILGGSYEKRDQPIILQGSCDADWASDVNDRRSTSGYLFSINQHTISWQSRKQQSVATSSTEAEYQALASATSESLYLRTLLSELNFTQKQPTTILQDNRSTIALAHNPINHRRTKHIDVSHHHIRDCIEHNQITLQYCSTEDMTADALTKALPRKKFEHCRNYMGILPLAT